MLERRAFGSTGLQVSPLGLGTVKFGRDKGLKHPGAATIPSDREALAVLELAADLGINLIDTAPAYGASEERLGSLLAQVPGNWVVCTKVGEEFDNITGIGRFDFTPEHIRFSVERSLARLSVGTLDIVLVHSDGNDVAIIRQGALDALKDLKTAGKIRGFGMSTKTVEGGLMALEQADCAMVTYNLGAVEDLPVIERAQVLGKGILIKKPLASGRLGTDGVTTSFRHILSCPGVGSVIVGTTDPAHLTANVAACEAALASRRSA